MNEYYLEVYNKQKEMIMHFKLIADALREITKELSDLNTKLDLYKLDDFIENNLEKIYEVFIRDYSEIATNDEFEIEDMLAYETEVKTIALKLMEEEK